MKKNNRVLRIGLLALVLTLVTASLVSGTFAKYVTTVNGTGTLEVAKWFAHVGKDASSVAYNTPFNLAMTIENNADVKLGTDVLKYIAPGTKGSFSLAYDTTTTEVDHSVTIDLKVLSGTVPQNLKFTVDSSNGFVEPPSVFTSTGTTFKSGLILAATNGQVGNITIKWDWPVGTTNEDIKKDTADGVKAETLQLQAVFTATQETGTV